MRSGCRGCRAVQGFWICSFGLRFKNNFNCHTTLLNAKRSHDDDGTDGEKHPNKEWLLHHHVPPSALNWGCRVNLLR